MNVLIACEESQIVCAAFRERGHNAFSCDIQEPSGGHPEWHMQGDVIKIIQSGVYITMNGVQHNVPGWDLIIAHPPCTFLSNAGACRMYPRRGVIDKDRFAVAMQAKEFFMFFYNLSVERLCIENPLPLSCVKLPPFSQVIQPYEYGHPYSKKTCLWLRGLPFLQPTKIINEYKPYISCGTSRNKGNPDKSGFSRKGGAQKVRSKTFPGIAAAMAEQWGI